MYNKYNRALKYFIKNDNLYSIINNDLKQEFKKLKNYKYKYKNIIINLDKGYDNINTDLCINFKIIFSQILIKFYVLYNKKLLNLKEKLETKKSIILIKNLKNNKKNKIKKKIYKTLAKFKYEYYNNLSYILNNLKPKYLKLTIYFNKLPNNKILNIKEIKNIEINIIENVLKFNLYKDNKILEFLENKNIQFKYAFQYINLNKDKINKNLTLFDNYNKYYEKNNYYLYNLNEIITLQINYVNNLNDLINIIKNEINFKKIKDLFNSNYVNFMINNNIFLKDNKDSKFSSANIIESEEEIILNKVSKIFNEKEDIVTKNNYNYKLLKGHTKEEKKYFDSIKFLLNGVNIFYKNKKLIKSRSFNPFLLYSPIDSGFSSTFLFLNMKKNVIKIKFNNKCLDIEIKNIKKIIISINTKEFIKYIWKNKEKKITKYFEIGILRHKNSRVDILINGFNQFKYLMNALLILTKKKNLLYQISKKIIKLKIK